MPTKAVHKWMSDEMERLSMKFARYKPSCNGYNRIQPVLLSRSVTQMLNNPLPVEDQIGSTMTTSPQQQQHQPKQQQQQQNHQRHQQQQQQLQQQGYVRPKGVLSRSEAEWEEVYPTVQFGRSNCCERDGKTTERKFAYYRNCSTRIK